MANEHKPMHKSDSDVFLSVEVSSLPMQSQNVNFQSRPGRPYPYVRRVRPAEQGRRF